MSTAKSYSISKQVVWEAYLKVKANKGAAGVDGQSISEFEENLKDNLYKIWNRMSSGCYFPPPIRMVEIPKGDKGTRKLGIPTVADRIAQMVAKRYLEPKIEPYFYAVSYGYRPNKSALEAVGQARERCWRHNWVLDLDIQSFFDNLDHEMMMRAVRKHTDCKWLLIYIERWLKAPIEISDGNLKTRDKGTPQGGVISPLLANLFLHYAFDKWMKRNYSNHLFERYADDILVHCKTEEDAIQLRKAIEIRLAECNLSVHPEKTKIIYCKDDSRRGSYLQEKFDFLGYTFRPRRSKNRYGKYFISLSPSISSKSTKAIRQIMKRWRIHLRSDKSLKEIAQGVNPILHGWINYYGKYYKSDLTDVFRHLNRAIKRWAMRKYKKLKSHPCRASHWLGVVAMREPQLFAHWKIGLRPMIK